MDANIVSKVRSPITFFAIAVVTCNTVFAICASWLKDRELFIFSMNMFLSIVFFFGSIVIWTPACLYHPKDVGENKLPYHPWVPTVTFFIGVVLYMTFVMLYAQWFPKKS